MISCLIYLVKKMTQTE